MKTAFAEPAAGLLKPLDINTFSQLLITLEVRSYKWRTQKFNCHNIRKTIVQGTLAPEY